MIDYQQYQKAVARAESLLKQAGIVITPAERERFEVADFGLGDLEKTGLEVITYVNTERCCGKELVMFPQQTCPEHRHSTKGEALGKEETFRCR
jgi:D-lyxose ketol-isomerase